MLTLQLIGSTGSDKILLGYSNETEKVIEVVKTVQDPGVLYGVKVWRSGGSDVWSGDHVELQMDHSHYNFTLGDIPQNTDTSTALLRINCDTLKKCSNCMVFDGCSWCNEKSSCISDVLSGTCKSLNRTCELPATFDFANRIVKPHSKPVVEDMPVDAVSEPVLNSASSLAVVAALVAAAVLLVVLV